MDSTNIGEQDKNRKADYILPSTDAFFAAVQKAPQEKERVTLQEIGMILQKRGLLKALSGRPLDGQAAVRNLTCDSREAGPGTLFICKGAAFKECYLREAAGRGSIAYISESPIATEQRLTGLLVTDIRMAMAVVSACFYKYQPGNPILTGITGTKGKTTTAWYLKAMLDEWAAEKNEAETGLISTVSYYDGKEREESAMTTPEAPELHRHLRNARETGIKYVTMEVSSQALKYRRVRELRFQVGIFLNISEDHISPQEHEDFEDYFHAKLSMFRQTDTAIVNINSDYSDRILKAARKSGNVITFGRHPKADLRISSICCEEGKLRFRAACADFSERFELAMRGSFNVENAAAAIAAAHTYGVPVPCMKRALAKTCVPGRMENYVSKDGKICAIVDFAHNKLSFERLFDTVYSEYRAYRKIITVFGCPGGKAYNRRKELGMLAGLFSDFVIITSDDPGMECQEDITREVMEYVERTGCPVRDIAEREKAVRQAVTEAAFSDVKTLLLVLGRGDARYLKIGKDSCAYPADSTLVKKALEEYDASVVTCSRMP